MKNLQSFGVQELNAKEIKEIDGGGGGWWLAPLYDAIKWIVTTDNEGYGRRMVETGSPGGHK